MEVEKILHTFFNRVPLGKYFLLWFLAVLMGSSLLWLHFGFTSKMVIPVVWLMILSGMGLLWGTSRPRWERTYCSWCSCRVQAKIKKYDPRREGWVMLYECSQCGQVTEKFKSMKGKNNESRG